MRYLNLGLHLYMAAQASIKDRRIVVELKAAAEWNIGIPKPFCTSR